MPTDQDLIVSFGVLHHLPSYQLRLQFLKEMIASLNPNGKLVITWWQFANQSKYQTRLTQPSQLNLDPSQLESGDYILDWQRGKSAYRYCHHLGESEAKQLLNDLSVTAVTAYRADGPDNQSNIYWIINHDQDE